MRKNILTSKETFFRWPIKLVGSVCVLFSSVDGYFAYKSLFSLQIPTHTHNSQIHVQFVQFVRWFVCLFDCLFVWQQILAFFAQFFPNFFWFPTFSIHFRWACVRFFSSFLSIRWNKLRGKKDNKNTHSRVRVDVCNTHGRSNFTLWTITIVMLEGGAELHTKIRMCSCLFRFKCTYWNLILAVCMHTLAHTTLTHVLTSVVIRLFIYLFILILIL